MFKKGDEVVKILKCAGVETASLGKVGSVRRGQVRLEGGGLVYDAKTGKEIDPFFPAVTSRLVVLEQ